MLLCESQASAYAYLSCAYTLYTYEAGVMEMESLLVKGMCVCEAHRVYGC